MNDFERVNQELIYKLEKGKIISYMIERYNRKLIRVEIVDPWGRTHWSYFDKKTGIQIEE